VAQEWKGVVKALHPKGNNPKLRCSVVDHPGNHVAHTQIEAELHSDEDNREGEAHDRCHQPCLIVHEIAKSQGEDHGAGSPAAHGIFGCACDQSAVCEHVFCSVQCCVELFR